MSTGTIIGAAAAAGTGVAVIAGVTAPIDWGGIGTAIFAFCTFVTMVLNQWTQRRDRREAKEEKKVIAQKLEEVKIGVDGKMTQMIGMVSEKVAAETKLGVIEEAKRLEGADALAVQKAQPTIVPLAAAGPAPVEKQKNGEHSAEVSAVAELVEARRLLAEVSKFLEAKKP